MDDWIHFVVNHDILKEQFQRVSNVPLPADNTELYTFCIRQLLWEFSFGSPCCASENIEILFRLLFNHLFTAYQSGINSEINFPYYRELQQVRLKALTSFSEPHSIEVHARNLKISVSYFQYLYKKLFGISFHQDLIQMRIDHAKHSLLTSNLPINQIADICGYTNEVHFYRQFKKITGTSPAQFRKSTGF